MAFRERTVDQGGDVGSSAWADAMEIIEEQDGLENVGKSDLDNRANEGSRRSGWDWLVVLLTVTS